MPTWTLPEGARPVEPLPGTPPPGTELRPVWQRRFATRVADGELWGARFFVGEGPVVTGRLIVHPELEGGPGVIHGGVLATVFDELQGISGMLMGLPAVTAHLEVDYRAPVPIGSTVELESTVEGKLGRKVYLSARATVGGKLVASSRSIFVVVGTEGDFGESASEILGISP